MPWATATVGYTRPEEAYPQVLQDRLDARGERVEVFNVALGGWSTRQELPSPIGASPGADGPLDQVLVGVCLNDVQPSWATT